MTGLCDGLSYDNALQLLNDWNLRSHLDGEIKESTGTISAAKYYAERVETMESEFAQLGIDSGSGLLYHIQRIKIELLAGALVNCIYLIEFIRTHKPKEVQSVTELIKQQLCCSFADLLITRAEGGGLI